MNLQGKTIIVTGGAGRLGRAFVRAIAQNGGVPVVADIDLQSASAVATEAVNTHMGRVVVAEHVDINSVDSVRGLLERVHRAHGPVTAIVNNAYPRNARYGRSLEDVELSDFCENTTLHLGGYFNVMKEGALYFKGIGGGTIINIASVYGVIPPRFDLYEGTEMTMPVEYAAIKSAVIHLTKYFAKYYQGQNIRFNALSPGGIQAGQPKTFLQRYAGYSLNKGMLNEDDISGALVFLLSDESSAVNGHNLIVDDGFTL